MNATPGWYPTDAEWPTHCGETAFWNGARFLCGRCHHEWRPVSEDEQVARAIYVEFNDSP